MIQQRQTWKSYVSYKWKQNAFPIFSGSFLWGGCIHAMLRMNTRTSKGKEDIEAQNPANKQVYQKIKTDFQTWKLD